MIYKQMETNKEFATAVKQAKDDLHREVLARRASRTPPDEFPELAEFFLNTQAEDMEFELARCRPKLTPEFFRFLDTTIGQERFSPKPDQERLAEMETLRQYLEEGVKAVDAAVQQTASAVDRMTKLLNAKDKKEMILDMVGNNEIDQPLVDLLQQNIDAARAANQEKPALFMEKVMGAIAKYLVTK